MSYLSIVNLYKAKEILEFKWVWALEKVHGSSAHVAWKDKKLEFFSGGTSQVMFEKLFDHAALTAAFEKLGHAEVTVYGEAFGGKCQGMSDTYGKELRFIAFDVCVVNRNVADPPDPYEPLAHAVWLDVPNAYEVATGLGIAFVPFEKVSTDVTALDAIRDRSSQVAESLGFPGKPREGVVLRPPFEVRLNNRHRVITKHKGEAFKERENVPKVASPEALAVLEGAQQIADEWVTEMRLTHVLDKLSIGRPPLEIQDTPLVKTAMVADVLREAAGEIVPGRDVERAIGNATAKMFRKRITTVLPQG